MKLDKKVINKGIDTVSLNFLMNNWYMAKNVSNIRLCFLSFKFENNFSVSTYTEICSTLYYYSAIRDLIE